MQSRILDWNWEGIGTRHRLESLDPEGSLDGPVVIMRLVNLWGVVSVASVGVTRMPAHGKDAAIGEGDQSRIPATSTWSSADLIVPAGLVH
jgi:hypothetical protein